MRLDRTALPLGAARLLAPDALVVRAAAQDSAEDLAKKLSNPVTALISVPMQLNCDQDIGSARRGERWLLNVQPVIPITLNQD